MCSYIRGCRDCARTAPDLNQIGGEKADTNVTVLLTKTKFTTAKLPLLLKQGQGFVPEVRISAQLQLAPSATDGLGRQIAGHFLKALVHFNVGVRRQIEDGNGGRVGVKCFKESLFRFLQLL